MHDTGAFQDRNSRAEREQAALHELGEDIAEDLKDTAAFSVAEGVELGAESDLANEVESEEDVKRGQVDELVRTRCSVELIDELLWGMVSYNAQAEAMRHELTCKYRFSAGY